MADGNLTFDTKVDTDGFVKGTNDLKNSLKGVLDSTKKTGQEINNAFNGSSSSVMRVENSIKITEQAMNRLSDEMKELASTKIPTQEYTDVKNQLESTQFAFDKLQEKQEKFLATGGKTNSKAFKNMEYDLEQLSNTIAHVKGELDQLTESGQAFTLGADSGQYQDMQMKYLDLADKADIYKQRLAELNQKESEAIQRTREKKARLTELGKSQEKVAKSSKKMAKEFKNTNKATVPLSKGILRLGNMFKLMLLRMAMRAVIQGVKEGFQNLAQYSKTVNKDMSMVSTSMLQLKNSFATAFAPIMTVVTPILRTLIDYLSQAISVMGQFFAVLLTGASTFTKAKKAQVDFAKSTKASGKEASKALSPIDKLNVVGSDAGGGGGASGPNPADMFEEIAISSKIKEFAKTTKKVFKDLGKKIKQLYKDLGKSDTLKGIKEGIESINFDKIKENFKKSFKNIGEIAKVAFNEMIPVAQSAGKLIGLHLKYNIATVGNLFEPISTGFANFTESMKEPIKEWIAEISTSLTNGLDNLSGAYETIGNAWLASIEEYKPAIEEQTQEIFTNIAKTMMLVGTIGADTFSILSGAINDFVNENEADIARFTDSIIDIFASGWGLINVIWKDGLDILDDFWQTWGKGIVEDIGSVLNDIGALFLDLWNNLIKPVWDRMLKFLQDAWNDCFKDIMKELLNFIGKLYAFLKVFWDKILQPLINLLLKVLAPAFKQAFDFILDVAHTLLKGIGGVVKSILKRLGGILDFLTGAFTGDWKKAFEGLKTIFTSFWSGVYSVAKAAINLVINVVNGFVQAIVTGLNTLVKGINAISFKVPDWVPGVGGKSVGFNLKEMTAPKIPKLATGTVVPANYGEFMAILGDNTREPEVVSPISTLKQAMAEVLAELGGMGGDIHLDVYLSGKQIHTEVVTQDKIYKKSTGQSAFA